MFNLKSYLTSKNQQINSALNEFLIGSSRIETAMKYSLMAGGKRIRPVLCIAAAEAVGGSTEDVLSIACAIEMIHTYSLIHDDLPAMDNDDLRRGKPTCHVAFDEATAILAGDALLTLAFEILSTVPCDSREQAIQLLEVIKIISQAAGYSGMIEGQMQDIAAEGVLLAPDELAQLHELKTGALIKAAVWTGAVRGNGNPDQIGHLKIYAENIGLAFQVTDDILNVEGDPALMGKAVGTDETRKKSTYPSLLGMEKSKQMSARMIDNALQSLNIFDSKAEPLQAVARYIIERKR